MKSVLFRTFLALVVQLLALASPIGAQDTTAVKGYAKRDSLDAVKAYNASRSSTVRAAMNRIKARTDSINKALRTQDSTIVVVPPKPDTSVVVVPPPVVDTTRDSVIVTPGPTPGPIAFTHPFGPPANGAILAALPQDTVDVSYPTIARRVACSNLQACLDTARAGDEIRLTPGASFTDAIVRPTSRALWTVVRTDITDAQLGLPGERMTPAKAAALNLATIRSSGSSTAAITVASGAHHVRFVGVRVTTSAPQTNALVRIGLGESVVEQLPHHITLDRVVVDPGANDLKRCVVLDGAYLAVLSSTLANCHSNAGDSQGILSINGKGPLRIENNTIQGGHQSFMFGGGDPAIKGQVPSDVVVSRNDLSRPLAWKGVWQGKTSVELKLGKRVLIEGNTVRHTWPDAQDGFAFLLKSVNQDGTAPWSETSDITVRYNAIVCAAGGFNLAPAPQGPAIPMARVAIYGNTADSISVGPCSGSVDGMLVQGVSDVIFRDNWVRNPTGRSAIYFVGTQPRFVATGNTFGGSYGLKGDGAVYTALTPGAQFSGNTLVPGGTTFATWPAAPSDTTRARLLNGVVVP